MLSLLVPTRRVWQALFNRLASRPRRVRSQRHRAPLPLRLEELERRETPATFNVVTAADLQNAINTANQDGNPSDTINIAAGTYMLGSALVIQPSSSPKTYTIVGQGEGITTLQGLGTDRVLHVLGDTSINLSIQNLTITGGMALNGGEDSGANQPVSFGGGILIDEINFAAQSSPGRPR